MHLNNSMMQVERILHNRNLASKGKFFKIYLILILSNLDINVERLSESKQFTIPKSKKFNYSSINVNISDLYVPVRAQHRKDVRLKKNINRNRKSVEHGKIHIFTSFIHLFLKEVRN